jgi:mercuric ion transport protein
MSKITHIPVDHTDGSDRTVTALLPGVGLVAAIAALVGASCCVLPLMLAAIGVGGAWIAQLAVFVTYQWYILTLAVLLITISWIAAFVRGSSRRTKLILAISTALVAAAFVMPIYEDDITQQLLKMMRG